MIEKCVTLDIDEQIKFPKIYLTFIKRSTLFSAQEKALRRKLLIHITPT